jgi:hypothetical protein
MGLSSEAAGARPKAVITPSGSTPFSRWVRFCLPAKLEQTTQKKMKHSDDGQTMAACYIRHPKTVLGKAWP